MVATAQKCMKIQNFGFSACSDIGTGTCTLTKVFMHVGEFRDTLMGLWHQHSSLDHGCWSMWVFPLYALPSDYLVQSIVLFLLLALYLIFCVAWILTFLFCVCSVILVIAPYTHLYLPVLLNSFWVWNSVKIATVFWMIVMIVTVLFLCSLTYLLGY